MNMNLHRSALALLCAVVLVICGCGGGGNSGGNATTNITISGTAATGAAFDGAGVTLWDASGTTMSCGNTDSVTGAFTCTVPLGLKLPFVLQAKRSDSNEALYSVVAEKKSGITNITPLTTAIVAGLSPSGAPEALGAELRSNSGLVTVPKLQVQVTLLEQLLANLISAATPVGYKFDPIAGSFTAGSESGMDKILDLLKVVTVPASPGVVAFISIYLRVDPDIVVKIEKGNEAASVALPPISANLRTIIDAQPATLIANFLTRMNVCFSIPVDYRVDDTISGTSDNIFANDCRTLFAGDDPNNYKNGGNVVGVTGEFSAIFSSAATGSVFDRGSLEYVVNSPGSANDGQWVVSYRVTDLVGNVTFDTFFLIKAGTGSSTELKQAGNQYDYDTSVQPFVQSTDFINAPTNNYITTGYTIHLATRLVGGISTLSQALVTSPNGQMFTLKPADGNPNLGLVLNPGSVTSETILKTNFLRIGSENADMNNMSPAYPARESTRMFFASPQWTDADIAAIPAQGVWTFDITLADGVTHVVQKCRTVARAYTMTEVRKLIFPKLTDILRADLASSTTTTGYYSITGDLSVLSIGDVTSDGWDVPTGAMPPNSVQVFGKSGVAGREFNDSVTVQANARKALIECRRLYNTDLHCATGVATGSSGFFANGTLITDLQFNASTNQGTISTNNVFYIP